MIEGTYSDYKCGCCESGFCYRELLKSYDDRYGELYLICPCCGGECFPEIEEESEDDTEE